MSGLDPPDSGFRTVALGDVGATTNGAVTHRPADTSSAAARSLGSIVATVAPATLVVQLLSFASSIALARVLGASQDTDAYFLALSVPVFTYAILLAATRLGTIPGLTTAKHEQPARLGDACSQVVTATLAAAAALAAVMTALALVVIPLVAEGTPRLLSMARMLILELAPYAVTGALTGVLGAILAVEGKFVLAILAMGFEPVVKTVLVLSAGSELGVQSLVIGNLVGGALAVGALWALVAASGIRLRFMRPGRTRVVRDLMKISAPLLLSQSVLQINPLIDRTMASGVSRGSVTVLDLALRLSAIPVVLLGATMIGPLSATWSARRAAAGWPALRDGFRSVVTTAVMTLPLLVAIGFALRHVLVAAMYSGGAYSSGAIDKTGTVLGMFLLGLPAEVLIVPLATLFIVQKDAVLPLKIAVANVILNVVLNAILRGPLGVAGIALSTALTLSILCVAYMLAARRRWGSLALRTTFRPAALSAASAVLVAVAGTLAIREVDPVSTMGRITLALVVASGAALVHVAVLAAGGAISPGRLPIALRARATLARGRRRRRHSRI